MCLGDEAFADLCELYPNTEEILKIRSLNKRAIFMKCMKAQEDYNKNGEKKLSSFVYKADIPFNKVP